MPICHESTLDKIVDYVPDIIEKFCKKDESQNEDSVIKNIEIKEQMKKQKEEVEDLNEEYLEDE